MGQGVPGPGSTPALTARYAEDRTVVGERRAALARRARAGAGAERQPRARARRAAGRSGERGLRPRRHARALRRPPRRRPRLLEPARWSALALRAGGAVRGESARPAAPTAASRTAAESSGDAFALGFRGPPRPARPRAAARSQRWDHQRETILDTRSPAPSASSRRAHAVRAAAGREVAAHGGPGAQGELVALGAAPEFDELFRHRRLDHRQPTMVPSTARTGMPARRGAGRGGACRWNASWCYHASHVQDLMLYERSNPGARAR
jgi:hypothetical protein